jgi:ABC-type phosphonate transport system ATPase subunit
MTKVVSQTLHVDADGGPLSVLMTAGHAAPGHYTLTLLAPDAFTVVEDFGIVKFGSAAGNTHALPGSAADNDRRILQAVTSVGIVDQNRDYAVFMDVLQGGNKVGTISDHGPDASGTSDTVESELDGEISATKKTLRSKDKPSLKAAKNQRQD